MTDDAQVRVRSVDEGGNRVLPDTPESGHIAAWTADGNSLLLIEQVGARACTQNATALVDKASQMGGR